jgi:hypothetical protein
MDYLIFTVLLIGCIAYVVTKSKKAKKTMAFQTQSTVVSPLESTMKEAVHERLPFAERLNKTKALYPFTNWRANFFEYDMEQYILNFFTTFS